MAVIAPRFSLRITPLPKITRPAAFLYLATMITCVLPFGCAAPGPTPLTYSVRRLPSDEVAGVLEQARAALESNGFPIAQYNPSEGVVISQPVRTDAARTGDAARRRQSRRVATVRVIPGDEGINVYCKVEIQQQATETYRFFRQESSRSDVPDETAIDRDAATTTQQNTVWRTIRRDKSAERRILDTIVG